MKEKLRKIKQFIAKHNELFFIIALCIIIFGITVYIETEPFDELWNFQNIYKMYNGYKIYIDANVIITPLFHLIGVGLFKIFGANFLIFKLYGVVINSLIFVGVYKIFKSLNVSKLFLPLLTILVLIIGMNICHNTTNYNNMCVMFIVYGILIIINKNKFSNSKFVIMQSIILFLVALTKQSIGLLYFISIIIYNLIFEKKLKIKNILTIIIINMFFGILLFVIFNRYGIWDGFISYAILGIKEFAIKNFTFTYSVLEFIGIILITCTILIIFNLKKIVKEDKMKNINIIACFAFPLLGTAYPIFNVAHVDLSLFFMYILLIYMLYLMFDNEVFNIKIINRITISSTLLLLIISTTWTFLYFYEMEYNSNLYLGAIFDDETKNKIEDIIDYINESEEKVIVFSVEAGFYMMPLNISNGSMDEPLLGNFGKDGEQGIVKKISEMSNAKILINKEKKVYQESDMVVQYIKDNLVYIGEMYDFMIYRTKK